MYPSARRPVAVCCLLVLCSLTSGCSGHRHTHERLHAVLWRQTAVEGEMAAVQTFRAAADAVDRALTDPTWSAVAVDRPYGEGTPTAIILDIDETCLDNSPVEARFIKRNGGFHKPTWNTWVTERAAPAMAGAADFFTHVRDRGVAVFFVTNRKQSEEADTVANLQHAFGPWVDAVRVLCRGERPEWTDDKTSRRLFVARTHRVLVLLGDDYNDFVRLEPKPTPAQRTEQGRARSANWGRTWFLVPNCSYGSWESALYGGDFKLSDHEILRRKYERLNTVGSR